MDLSDFPQIFNETSATIRARLDADVNAGLSTDDPRWVDTRQGTFYWDITQVVVLELARLWDALSVEIVAAAFPVFAWGEYLDHHGGMFDLQRKEAVAADGTVRFTGAAGTVIGTGVVVSADATEDEDAIEFVTTQSGQIPVGTGTFIDLTVEAVEPGEHGNVSTGAITELESPVSGVTSVTNMAPIEGGLDVESDEDFRERILVEFEGSTGPNQYRKWALSRPGVSKVFVNPVWQGPGTVQIVVMASDGSPVAASVVTDVQNYIDPAVGEGQAPAGVAVTVQTSTVVNVSVSAAVTFKTGYALDGTGGTKEQRSVITKALRDYINNIDVGGTVVFNNVLAQFFRAPGVLNVTGLTVNGGTANITLTGNPPQVAKLNEGTGQPALS